jgi:hypothetical protein
MIDDDDDDDNDDDDDDDDDEDNDDDEACFVHVHRVWELSFVDRDISYRFLIFRYFLY